MKPFKILTLLFIALVTFNCSSDDDSPAPELTTQQLLMSGRWYYNSASNSTVDSCQKNSYYDFTNAGTMIVESFRTNVSDQCTSNNIIVAPYVVSEDNKNIEVTLEGDKMIISIEFISESQLILKQNGLTAGFVKKS
ncbi:MAG: lipocalin family protein [Gelidibacter sp.]